MMIPTRSPTSLDVYFAAHILLMADPPFPDAVLQIQLLEFYPGLIEHARRIQAQVAQAPSYQYFTPSESLLSTLVPRSFRGNNARTQVDPADIQYKRTSLLYMVAMAAMAAACLYTHFLAIADFVEDSEGGGEDADDDEGGGSEEQGEGELADGFTEQDED